MTTTFPPKPWEEGATFTNDTTGVGYTYSGGKWLASGGPKVEGEYLPLTGGKVSGELKVAADGNAFSIARKNGNNLLSSFTGSYSEDIQYWKQPDDYGNSLLEIVNGFKLQKELDSYLPLTGGDLSGQLNIKANSGVCLSVNNNKVKFWSSGAVELNGYTAFKDNELVTKAYTDGAIKDALDNIEPPSAKPSLPVYKFAVRNWGSLRPGEVSFVDAQGGGMSNFDSCKGIIFHATDINGDRAMSYGANDFTSDLGSALNILSETGSDLYFRIAEVQKATGFVKVSYGKNEDSWWFAWDSAEVAVKPGGFNQVSDGFKFSLQCPDVLF